jgi:hypothetical protein
MTPLTSRTDAPWVAGTLQRAGPLETWSLAHAVAAAARKVDERILTLVGQTNAAGGLGARTLLALLAFCYARQIYGSIEVVTRLRYDEGLRGLCDELTPDPGTIRQFRTENRQALEFCLQAALRFQAEEKVAHGLLTKVNEERVVEEARRRITMAMFTDSMDLEKEGKRDNQVSFAC